MTRRTVAGLAALMAVVIGALLVAVAGTALAQAPQATGWWSFASQSGQNAPPPPDMSDGDLLVQGGDLGGSAPDLGLPTSPTALAALRFVLIDGAEVGALTLQVGSGARATDVRAYPVKKDDWQPSQGGPLGEAPEADPRRYSAGVVNADGTALVFRDISRLVPDDGSPLSVVLVPAASDRVVIKKPAANALAVTEPASGSAVPDPATFGPPPSSSEGAASGGGSAGLPGFSGDRAGAGSFGGDPGAPVALAPQAAAPGTTPPVVAGAPVAGSSAAELALARLRADTRTRYLVGLEALLVLLTFGLLGWGPFRRLAPLTGQPPEPDEGRARGVGRFARVRSGAVVRL